MSIISVNIDEGLLEEANNIESEFGFKGRSDLFRTALVTLGGELKQKKNLSGEIDAIIVLIHKAKNTEVSKIIHKYSSLIKTQMHNHTASHKCMEIFVLNGDAKKVQKMHQDFLTNKKIEVAKLIIP
jgi:CopG family nickel-responsive transcriptional regulator